MGELLVTFCVFMACLGGCAIRPESSSHAELNHRTPPAPEAFFDDPWSQWPRLNSEQQAASFTSFDRSGGNADGFEGLHSSLYQDPKGHYAIFDAHGPGVLDTLWFTGPDEGGEGLDLGLLRFYFDNETRPRLTISAAELFSGRRAEFPHPLVAGPAISTGGYASWVPLPYAKRLVITASKRPGFYAAHYRRLGLRSDVSSWRADRSLIRQRAIFRRRTPSKSPEHPPVRVPLHYEHHGAGSIQLIRFNPKGRPTPKKLEQARVRIRWDGQPEPAVDAPLGMFFGSGLGETSLRSLAFSMRPGGPYENRFVMPFWRGFSIEILGMPGRLELAISKKIYPQSTTGHLYGRYRQEQTRPEEDFLFLDLSGQVGKLVGTVLVVKPEHPWTKRWWEGDLRSYVDGALSPSIHGTGVEDDHLGGWSNTFFSRPFSLPMHGEPAARLIEDQGLQHNAIVSLYRLWPGIPFLDGIRHGLEHGNQNTIDGHYRGLVFYYAGPRAPPGLKTVDRLDLGNRASRRGHRFGAGPEVAALRLRSSFEGEGYREESEDIALYHGQARFVLHFSGHDLGPYCLLRWRFDQRAGRQRATVLVDGIRAGTLEAPGANAVSRWAERDLRIPRELLVGRSKAIFEIIPHGAFSSAEYRLLCLGRQPKPKETSPKRTKPSRAKPRRMRGALPQ